MASPRGYYTERFAAMNALAKELVDESITALVGGIGAALDPEEVEAIRWMMMCELI